jgi:hypothetical protein
MKYLWWSVFILTSLSGLTTVLAQQSGRENLANSSSALFIVGIGAVLAVGVVWNTIHFGHIDVTGFGKVSPERGARVYWTVTIAIIVFGMAVASVGLWMLLHE